MKRDGTFNGTLTLGNNVFGLHSLRPLIYCPSHSSEPLAIFLWCNSEQTLLTADHSERKKKGNLAKCYTDFEHNVSTLKHQIILFLLRFVLYNGEMYSFFKKFVCGYFSGGAVGYGTAPQDKGARIRFPMGLFEFFE